MQLKLMLQVDSHIQLHKVNVEVNRLCQMTKMTKMTTNFESFYLLQTLCLATCTKAQNACWAENCIVLNATLKVRTSGVPFLVARSSFRPYHRGNLQSVSSPQPSFLLSLEESLASAMLGKREEELWPTLFAGLIHQNGAERQCA